MALTDADIYKTASEHTHTRATPTRYVTGVLSFARAIEAPLLARIAALTAQVEQAAQPVAWARIPRFTGSAQTPMIVLTDPKSTAWIPLYTAPPKAVPLTDEQINDLSVWPRMKLEEVVRVIEAAHGITPATGEKG